MTDNILKMKMADIYCFLALIEHYLLETQWSNMKTPNSAGWYISDFSKVSWRKAAGFAYSV